MLLHHKYVLLLWHSDCDSPTVTLIQLLFIGSASWQTRVHLKRCGSSLKAKTSHCMQCAHMVAQLAVKVVI